MADGSLALTPPPVHVQYLHPPSILTASPPIHARRGGHTSSTKPPAPATEGTMTPPQLKTQPRRRSPHPEAPPPLSPKMSPTPPAPFPQHTPPPHGGGAASASAAATTHEQPAQ